MAHVRDGSPPQTNMVRVDGQRSALLIVQKNGNASTLQIVSQIKEMLPRALATLPPGLDVRPLADQSLFVRAAIDGVIREAGIAAGLTALMILLFLGSWRSTHHHLDLDSAVDSRLHHHASARWARRSTS